MIDEPTLSVSDVVRAFEERRTLTGSLSHREHVMIAWHYARTLPAPQALVELVAHQRPGEVELLLGALDAMAVALSGRGATVLTFTFPDPTAVITVAAARIRARVTGFNERVRRHIDVGWDRIYGDVEMENRAVGVFRLARPLVAAGGKPARHPQSRLL